MKLLAGLGGALVGASLFACGWIQIANEKPLDAVVLFGLSWIVFRWDK